MFTGIIGDTGEIIRIEDIGGLRRVTIRTNFDVSQIDMGASIACDGCCLTVTEKNSDIFAVEISNETLDKTMLGNWSEGAFINLERSLKLGDEMGGHIVSGHVDGVATLESITKDGESYRLVFSVPDTLAHYMAQKGSVALGGISLTVNEVDDNKFGVNIIPHTWDVTTIKNWKQGDYINLEVDMLARYVARMLGK